MLVTLFTQLVQAAVVGIAVWCFFLAFGAVAIKESVQESWLGQPPDELVPLWADHGVTRELFRVATFIGGFAGLYFTVYALTDSHYRGPVPQGPARRPRAGGRRPARIPRASAGARRSAAEQRRQ